MDINVERLTAVHRNGEELWDAYDPTSQELIPLGYSKEELAKAWIAGYRYLSREQLTWYLVEQFGPECEHKFRTNEEFTDDTFTTKRTVSRCKHCGKEEQ